MSSAYPVVRFQRCGNKLRQGDIALGEFHQLRARSGEPIGPGTGIAEPDLPFLGEHIDFEVEVPRPGAPDKSEARVLRVWQGKVVVLHQNCEIDYANADDSRVTVAPVVSEPQWPEGPWAALRKNLVPGFFYLPPLSAKDAAAVGLPDLDVPEAVVALASATLSSRGLIRPRRLYALTAEMLPHLQEALVKFSSVRGFAAMTNLEQIIGKQLVEVRETGQSISGPSQLVKLFFQDTGDNDKLDEATVSYWGVRPSPKT